MTTRAHKVQSAAHAARRTSLGVGDSPQGDGGGSSYGFHDRFSSWSGSSYDEEDVYHGATYDEPIRHLLDVG